MRPSPAFRATAHRDGSPYPLVLWRSLVVVLLICAASLARAADLTPISPDPGRVILDLPRIAPPVPLFFSARADQTVQLAPTEITSEIRLSVRVLQGRADTLSIGLAGEGEVVSVSGLHLREWSLRQGAGEAGTTRFLDLRLTRPETKPGPPHPLPKLLANSSVAVPPPAQDFEFVVRTRHTLTELPAATAVLIPTPGDAVGFSAHLRLQPASTVDLRIDSAQGLAAQRPENPSANEHELRFVATGDSRLAVRLAPRGALAAEAELVGAELVGQLDATGRSVTFHLRGNVRAQKAGARLRLLSGRAAFTGSVSGDGWHIAAVALDERRFAYELVAARAGLLAIDTTFAAAVSENGDWRALEFAMPAGAVVPLRLAGLGDDVAFKTDAAVVPVADNAAKTWQGFLPASGAASLAWKQTREAEEGALAFTTTEQTEVRIGAGLLHQTAQISFRLLQGKLTGIRCRLDGPGEIVGVEGANILGWKVVPTDRGRVLEVRLSRPMETAGTLTVQSQTELGAWPVRAEPLRLTPEGGVRHSGFVRIANRGAVRLEPADVSGMMQLAPAQFPGGAIEGGTRQVFVYRFPSSNYGYRVLASQIQPEVGLSAILMYELGETARVLHASLELDVREAPLREWSLRVPEDYTVVSVIGSDVADHVAESAAANGYRTLRILFSRAIEGRQLLELRLEKNEAAAAGDWRLPPLQFPAAKTVRGHVGVVAAPGYRIVPAAIDRLVETPLSFFPKQTPGLQQAWRLREPDWTAEVRIEALGQSVQADVFHLYSLREGLVTSSVLVNYFVVGAPANEWRLEVPADVGNIDVIGQNVRRDWRREGDHVIVTLHQPVLGAATLLVTFEQPMSARGGVISPGSVRPLGVQAERGFIQVVSPLQVKHEIRRIEGGLLKLEPTELPAEFRLLSSSPSLAVYHYTARPFTFEMGIEWYAPGDTVDQVIDFAKLGSQVSRDGQVVTEAKFFVKTRGRKALRLALPAGTSLWEARVDNEVVNARADAGHTLVPLPPRLNPNEPVTVALRLGQQAPSSGANITISAPLAVSAPIVISEWTVRADAGRVLIPQRSDAELLHPALTESGFEWITQRHPLGAFVLLALIGLGALLLLSPIGWRMPSGLFLLALGAALALLLAASALLERRWNAPELSFAATVVPAGETIALRVANLPAWIAWFVGWGAAAAAAGAALLILHARGGRLVGTRLALPLAGTLLLCTGILAQRSAAPVFFGLVSLAIFVRMIVPGVVLWRRERRDRIVEPGTGPAGAVTLLMFAAILGVASPDVAQASRLPTKLDAGGTPALRTEHFAEAITQKWSIRGERLFAEADVVVRGDVGESFLLLRAPAVLTEFKGEGLRVGKIEHDGAAAYHVFTERSGVFTARIRFELPVPDRTKPIALPTGPAATQRITVELDQGGWEFASAMAVQVTPDPAAGDTRSVATLVFPPHAAAVIQLQPRRRDLGAEAVQFFAEVSNLYVPAPGVVNGFARIVVRPVQGRVTSLELEVPAGFTVGDVSRGHVGAWRFDPEKRRLHVAIEPAQSGAFQFEVETQLGAGELPFALALAPLRVLGAAGDVGLLALAFGGDAQPEGIRATGVSAVNVQDFDASLVPRTREKQPIATVQNVWRYGQGAGRVELKIAPVAPEVRVTSRQVLSLDDDRMVMAIDLRVAITRVGLFKLSFALPPGLEVEALTGPALSHWTEAVDGAQRIVTLHLNGRTLGEQAFNLTLAGAAPGAQEAWAFPRFVVREATRQSGEALIVPGKGIRLRAAAREKVTQVDPRSLGGMQPGTLAFRLLQTDWALALGIERLDAWVTAQALEEVTLREGQMLTRIAIRYRVENAAVKTVRVRLPGLSDESVRTVRATGSAVSDIVRVDGTPDEWEVRFQRGIAGETDVQIEFTGTAAALGRMSEGRAEAPAVPIVTPEFIGARQVVQFVAVRSGGRLELEAGTVPRGWTRIDWSAVPAALQQRGDRSMPALCFRVAEPEGALTVVVRRHEVADALKLRVTQAELLTLFAPTGATLTSVELKVEVMEKSTLRVRLPAGAQLFHALVNGENVPVVREGEAWLFHVWAHAASERAGKVRLAYSANPVERRDIALLGPSLSVPLENVTWRVVIPPGYELDDYRGGLRLREERYGGGFGLDQYVSLVSSKRATEAKEAMTLLQQANSWLQVGDQAKAEGALLNVSGRNSFDEAANEDARVQLRNLKTQQAVLGLNTRRQRLTLDQGGTGARHEQLEQAANLNPVMKGQLNYDPRQAEQLMRGNTAEENTALRGIAARIVDQQLAAEPAPGAIEVTLPERGRVLTFTRSVQVDGAAPLELRLDVDKIIRVDWRLAALLLIGLAAIVGIELKRRSTAAA